MPVFFDPADPAFIKDPYPTLNALREAGPLHWESDWNLWLITRHDDVRAAQLDRRLGRVRDGHARPSDFRPLREMEVDGWEAYYAVERHSLLMLEGPEHARLRGLVSRAFAPRRVRDLREPVAAIAQDLLEGVADRPAFDLLADFAEPFSVRVIAALLGAPAADAGLLLAWSHAIVKMYEMHATPEQARAAVAASRDFDAWTRELIARRRAQPEDDLITALCRAETEEGNLSEAEIVSTVILLLNAGHEATVNTLGNGMTAMLQRGDAWPRVVSGETAAAVAIEEMMRFDPPLQMFERFVLEEGVEIAGRPLPVGAEVAMLFGAANRDPRRYRAPDQFLVDRGDADHITFGGGAHYCPGAPLARLELEEAVNCLASAFPRLALAAEPEREDGFAIRGFRAVEVAPAG